MSLIDSKEHGQCSQHGIGSWHHNNYHCYTFILVRCIYFIMDVLPREVISHTVFCIARVIFHHM